MRFVPSLLMITFVQITRILGEKLGPVIAPYRTVNIPPNNGTWVICSNHITDYVSYSIRVTSDFSVSPDKSCGQSYLGLPSSTSNIGPGVTTAILSHSNVNLFTSHQFDFAFVPSLSCIYSVVLSCDQDTGTIHIDQPDKYCLGVTNPMSVEQKVNVAVDFENTVFGEGGFTSPNQPGGNSEAIMQESGYTNSFSGIIFESNGNGLGMQTTTIRNAASLIRINEMTMIVTMLMAVVLGLL